jgi:glycerol-3-phosphate dehydrogenase
VPFSAADRPETLAALQAEEWDLLVIGGGVTGAGIAHDAALRGMRVALVEAGDLGGGTSSRSSRLVHGGLRYLESFGFGLVWESSAERARLLRLAPHLVRPLPFLFPLYRNGPVGRTALRAGMVLYDVLAAFRNIRGHRMLSPERVIEEEPTLRRDGLIGAALYYDASVDDARMALAAARAAAEAGAVVVSYAPAEAFLVEGDGVRGVLARDLRDPSVPPMTVRARVVLNATGPWSDRVRALADPDCAPRLRTTKGVHIMIPRARMGNRHAVTLRSPVDDRVMFVLPWGDFTYVGTTDTDFEGDPRDVQADAADVAYLLDSANDLFPDARLTAADVLSTWAGVRPLLAPPGDQGESATSREHEIWWEENGLLSIAGGKLTTFRVMAAEAVDEAVRGSPVLDDFGPSATRHARLPGAPEQPWDAYRVGFGELAAAAGLDAAAAEALVGRHGTHAEAILALIGEDPPLGARVVPGLPYLWAEVVYAVRAELALTLEDVMMRRTHLFYELADGGLEVAPSVASRMAREPGIGWGGAELASQLERYRREVAESRPARLG